MKSSPDSILIEKYILGDNYSFEILLNRYRNRVYSFIFSKVFDRDITEDIFQDTFIKVVKTLKQGNYKEEGRFLSWVMRISHNLIVDHFRKQKRIPIYESSNEDIDVFDKISDPSKNIENLLVENQIQSDLSLLIEELPHNQLEVLRMRVYQDMSFKEIADRTGVSINTALGRMRYALINLRRLIEDRDLIFTQ